MTSRGQQQHLVPAASEFAKLLLAARASYGPRRDAVCFQASFARDSDADSLCSTAARKVAMTSMFTPLLATALALIALAGSATAQTQFCSSPPFSVAAKPNTPAAGDFNRDGASDLLVPSGGSNDIALLLGSGQGFSVGAPISLGTASQAISVADFNNDNNADFAVVCPNGPNEVRVYLGNGAGSFGLVHSAAFTGAQFVAAANFNGDLNPDLAVTFGTASVAVLLGDGLGGFSPSSGSPFSVSADSGAFAAADLTGDGIADIAAVENLISAVSVLVNDGAGNLGLTTFAVANRPSDIAVGRVNGDAFPDIAVALAGTSPSDNRVEIRLNDGLGNFGMQPGYSPIPVGVRPLSVAFADIDADGFADLLTADHESGTSSFLWNHAGQTFVSDGGSPYQIGASPYGVAVIDIGADGYLDAVVGSGPANLQALVVCCTGSGPTVYCTAKLNSLFCLPSISLSTQPSASAGSGCLMSTANVLGKRNGLYFHGTLGAWAPPFHGGLLCVKPPLKRHGVLNSGGTTVGCNGVFTEDLNAYIASGADSSLVAGAQLWIQNWSRDPGDLYGDSLSDAIAATVCP